MVGDVREFRRMYICLGALKKGFRSGCRRVIGLDGCFLKGENGGHMLTAVGIDANNRMYPLAYAVVESENSSIWKWFLDIYLMMWELVTVMAGHSLATNKGFSGRVGVVL
ncbi:Uncharacterized protein Adt_39351 [Abeliophyllum distichum]|uniref:MULE transposase domain-containing protein n=1 Tax=Abeliophyllum distichum TaxID=126358 RepID=A0ABD1Q4V3_9LAMI